MKPHIVVISTKTCEPCWAMKPVYAELRSRGWSVYELDAAVHVGAMAAVKPRAFPCLIIQRPGGRVERVYGTCSIEYLERKLSDE